MIAKWKRCVDCEERFGLTRLQSHDGLFAEPDRCGICRPAHRRRLGATRASRYRLRHRHAESARAHADVGSAAQRTPFTGS